MEQKLRLEPTAIGVYVAGEQKQESYWQPVPANGYVTVALAPHIVGMEFPFALGTQSVAPGGYVREHLHERNEEAVYIIEGHGRAIINKQEYPIGPGSVAFIPKGIRHMFINDADVQLRWVWLILPNGLEDFFRLIGRPRQPGDRVPSNFPRPDNVLEIERMTVFGEDLKDKLDPSREN